MKIGVRFFENNIVEAISGGIYKISVQANGEEELLYIGESFSMLIRCATHLYSLKKNPEYFGFTEETIDREDIVIIVEKLEKEADMKLRKDKEKKYIKDLHPIMQSEISDRMKSVDDKISALEKFLSVENK